MKDALGTVQSVLVLGGNSDIAQATLRRLVGTRARKVVLAGRNADALEVRAKELRSLGATEVSTAAFDALDFAGHAAFVEEQFRTHGGFDLVLLAFGVLGDQGEDEANPQKAVGVIEANFTGAASVLLSIATKMRQQGHGSIVVLSTVAAERARAANFIYGSSKAGLDAFCQGLGDSLMGSGVQLMIVRPGFVTSQMTAHMETKPMATDPDAVAEQIVRGLARGCEIVWAPAKLRLIFAVLRHLPRPIFRKLKQ